MTGLALYALGMAALIALAAWHTRRERQRYARFAHLWQDTDSGL